MNITTSQNPVPAETNIGLLIAAFGLLVGLFWMPVAYVVVGIGLAMAWPALIATWRAAGGKRRLFGNALFAFALFAAPAAIAADRLWLA